MCNGKGVVMTIIDGIEVAIAQCDDCQGREFWIFRGQNGEGYKISCANCGREQRYGGYKAIFGKDIESMSLIPLCYFPFPFGVFHYLPPLNGLTHEPSSCLIQGSA